MRPRHALAAAGGLLTLAGALLPALRVGEQALSGLTLARRLGTALIEQPQAFDWPARLIATGALLSNLTALAILAWACLVHRPLPRALVAGHGLTVTAALLCSLLIARLPAARPAPGYALWLAGLLLIGGFAVLSLRQSRA